MNQQNNTAQLNARYPAEENFVVGVLVSELRQQHAWATIVELAGALRNVRSMAEAMRQEALHHMQARQQSSAPFQTRPAAVPSQPVSWSYEQPAQPEAEPVHPGEVDPDFDGVPWGQL